MTGKIKGALLPKQYILMSPDFAIKKKWLFYLSFLLVEVRSQDTFKAWNTGPRFKKKKKLAILGER